MSKIYRALLMSFFLVASTTAFPNGSSVISSVEYVYLLKDGKIPALVVVTTDSEIERLTLRAKEQVDTPLSAQLENSPIHLKLRARTDNLGLVGHVEGWGYRVFVVSRSQAYKFF